MNNDTEQRQSSGYRRTGRRHATQASSGSRPQGSRPGSARPQGSRPQNPKYKTVKPRGKINKRNGSQRNKVNSRPTVSSQRITRPSSENRTSSYQPYVKSKRNRTLERFAPLIYGAGILLVIYLVGVIYYSFHFLPGTIVNGKKVGGMRVSKAENVITKDYDSHILNLKEADDSESIDPKEIDLEISVGNEISRLCKAQGKASWPFHLFGKKKKTANLDIDYNEEKLSQVIDHLRCVTKENITPPANACIKAGKDKFEIQPEVMGDSVNKEVLHKAIEKAFATCKTELDFEKDQIYEQPTLYKDDKRLKAALSTANKYAKSKVSYDFTYTTEICDYNVFKNWIVVTDAFEVIYNDTDLNNYMNEISSKYNTVGHERKFTTFYGEQITVSEGDYGWQINQESEMAQLNADLKTGKEIKRKPIYKSTAWCQNGPDDDIGNSYVEVSIGEQMVYLFENGKKIISSPVVTGDTGMNYDTHKGVYAITYKQRNATLTGQGYSSPVSYWMPFNGNEGLHDAPWRSDFGGYIYQGGGSHGCVNCPPGVAAKLYQHVRKGFPVVVY